MTSNTERLFNAIVILGASLVAGCGSGSNDPNSKANPGPNGSSDAGPSFTYQPDAGALGGGWTGW